MKNYVHIKTNIGTVNKTKNKHAVDFGGQCTLLV